LRYYSKVGRICKPKRRLIYNSFKNTQVGVQPSVYTWYRFADIKNGGAVFGTAVRSQVGVQPSVYTWYRFADIKNSKLFLEL